MMRIGKEIKTNKGDGILRATFPLDDGRTGVIIEHKGKNFIAIQGDDF